jgi:hypothetical protein
VAYDVSNRRYFGLVETLKLHFPFLGKVVITPETTNLFAESENTSENEPTSTGTSAQMVLVSAMENNDFERVSLAIESRADPNLSDR